jgi:hypothetical protein
MKGLSVVCVTGVLLYMQLTATAAPVRWTVQAHELSGGPVTGYIVWDADAGSMSEWNIAVSGSLPFNGPGGCLPITEKVCVQNDFLLGSENTLVFSNTVVPYFQTVLVLQTTAPLTDEGGSVPLVPGVPGLFFGGHSAVYYPGTNAFPSAVGGLVFAFPEPATAGPLGVALGVIAGLLVRPMARRDRSG